MDTKHPDSVYGVLLVETTPGVFGGFKRSCIYENLSERDEHFTLCSICEGLMRDACTIEQLDNLACESCTGERAYSVFAVGRKSIAEINLRCPLSKRGCTWIGKSQIVEKHLETCEYFRVQCPLSCSEGVLRCDTEEHLNTCPNRLISCNYCDSIIEAYKVNTHILECSEYEIECTNGCNNKVKRKGLGDHIETSCPLSIIRCAFADLGCISAEVVRKDMEKHVEMYNCYHMGLIVNANSEQKRLFECLRSELEEVKTSKEELKEKVLTQSNEIIELKKENDTISKDLAEVQGGLLTVRARIPEDHGCYIKQELCMTLRDLKRMGETGNGTIISEIEIERYELDCYAKIENTDLLLYLRTWDGSSDDQLTWPFNAECQVKLMPTKKGVNKLEHRPIKLQLERVPHSVKSFLELSRDMQKVESKSSKLIGLFPLSIVLGDRYSVKDSLKLELTVKCYNLV